MCVKERHVSVPHQLFYYFVGCTFFMMFGSFRHNVSAVFTHDLILSVLFQYLETDSDCPRAFVEQKRVLHSKEGEAFIAKHKVRPL